MGFWHKSATIAYLAVFLGVCGHASSEFISVLCGVGGPELSVWRFLLGGFGLVILALIFPASRDLIAPFKTDAFKLIWLSILGVSLGYLLFHWSLDYATVPQVATTVTTIPIFVGLVNLWVNKQPFTTAKIVSGICATVGVAMWNTTITQFLWIGGLAAVPDITRGSYLFFLKPVIAACLAVVFLSQKLTAWQIMAIIVICASVLVESLLARYHASSVSD